MGISKRQGPGAAKEIFGDHGEALGEISHGLWKLPTKLVGSFLTKNQRAALKKSTEEMTNANIKFIRASAAATFGFWKNVGRANGRNDWRGIGHWCIMGHEPNTRRYRLAGCLEILECRIYSFLLVHAVIVTNRPSLQCESISTLEHRYGWLS